MKKIIAAMTPDRVIGKEGSIPWHLPEDLKNFKELTTGHTVLMGRKTYESLPDKFKPLPNRNNVVISTTMEERDEIDVCRSMEEGLEKGESYECDLFIIGGESIYRQALEEAEEMLISHVDKDVDGDTYFPEFDEEGWEVTEEEEFEGFTLKRYERL